MHVELSIIQQEAIQEQYKLMYATLAAIVLVMDQEEEDNEYN